MAKRWARDIEKELGSPTVDIDADTKAAEKKIERLEKDKHTTHVDVDVDAAKAEAELDAVTRDRTVKIDVDKSLWSGGFKHLGAEGIPGCAGGMASAGSEFASADATAGTSMGAGMGKALIPALIRGGDPGGRRTRRRRGFGGAESAADPGSGGGRRAGYWNTYFGYPGVSAMRPAPGPVSVIGLPT